MNPKHASPSLRQWQEAVVEVCGSVNSKQLPLQNWLHASNQNQLNIYRNNFLGAKLNVLEQTFPRLLKLLGVDYLRQCGRRYLSLPNYNCTMTANLNQLGEQFPNFLQELQTHKKELSAYPWLADLASLDYQLHSAYYAADDCVFNFDAFQQQSAQLGAIHFQLSHSIALIESSWPLADINANIESDQIQAQYAHTGHILCVYRQNQQIHVVQLNSSESALLQGVSQKLSMEELLEQCESCQQYLPLFIQRGWICDFSINNVTEQQSKTFYGV